MLKAAIRVASLYGNGDSSTFLMTLNMVVPAPIPSARVSTAKSENPGFPRIPRMPYRKSCQSDCMDNQTSVRDGSFPVFAAGRAWGSGKFGRDGQIRTADLSLRRRPFYPSELRPHSYLRSEERRVGKECRSRGS